MAASQPSQVNNKPSRLLSETELEQLTGISKSSWQKKRHFGNGPKYLKIGRLIRYDENDVSSWLQAQTRGK